MWYGYIGENICGWRLVRKGNYDFLTPFSGEFNFVNHKGDFISDMWFSWATDFIEETQMAIVHLRDGNVYTLDTHGKLVRKPERTLEGKIMDEIADAISQRWKDTLAEVFLLHPPPPTVLSLSEMTLE
jgi:hypothetical protein